MKRLSVSENLVVAVMQITGCAALLLLLTYTAWHTGGLFARHVQPPWIGYAAAIGVESSVVTLSAWIGLNRKSNRSVRKPMVVLGLVVLVSMLANIAEGFVARYSNQLTVLTVEHIDPVQAGIGFAATGMISVIVFALSDILGSNVKTVSDTVRQENQTVEATKADRLAWIRQMEGQVTPEAIVGQFGVTERTAYRDLGEYRQTVPQAADNGHESGINEA